LQETSQNNNRHNSNNNDNAYKEEIIIEEFWWLCSVAFIPKNSVLSVFNTEKIFVEFMTTVSILSQYAARGVVPQELSHVP
jgi:hypothetical protein